jgi:hypothetical protein
VSATKFGTVNVNEEPLGAAVSDVPFPAEFTKLTTTAEPKFVPVTVTKVPAEPYEGEMELITGFALTVYVWLVPACAPPVLYV